MFYKKILKPILFCFSPEFIHDYFLTMGEWLGKTQATRNIVQKIYGYNGPDISRTIDGIKYKTPFLLSAGFDNNARLTVILPCIGFAGVEVGSVTAKVCLGNEKPRLRRLPNSKSIIVNKGLRNDGVDTIIERLKKIADKKEIASKFGAEKQKNEPKLGEGKNSSASGCGIVGVSIARTNDISCLETQCGIDDYAYSFQRLNEEDVGDYYTLNISCPNSFGGESFADPVLLEMLVARIDSIPCKKPVYVKMPINLEWNKFDSILKVLDKHGISGVIIGNLNKDYSYISNDPDAPKSFVGGLSGEPCRELSNDLIRKTRFNYGKRFTIIGCGGVMNPDQAREKFDAGADLVQLITGMILEGPGLIKKLCESVALKA